MLKTLKLRGILGLPWLFAQIGLSVTNKFYFLYSILEKLVSKCGGLGRGQVSG